jgi:hypothetical protein
MEVTLHAFFNLDTRRRPRCVVSLVPRPCYPRGRSSFNHYKAPAGPTDPTEKNGEDKNTCCCRGLNLGLPARRQVFYRTSEPISHKISAPNKKANVRHAWLFVRFGNKFKISSEGGDYGSKKCNRGYGVAYGGIWRCLCLAGVWNKSFGSVLVLSAGIWLQSPWRCLHILVQKHIL